MKNVRTVLAVLFLALGATTFAQPGSLDGTFGAGGKVTTAFVNGAAVGYSVAIQSDGKIVVAGEVQENGTSDFALARYKTSGSLDISFGVGGKVTTDFSTSIDYGYAVAIQSDGKIIVAGCTYPDDGSVVFALARYNTDGTLDNSFGTGGKVTTAFGISADFGYSVAIQPDGKIVVAGSSGTSAGYDFALARYNTNGSLDNSFGVAGIVTTNFGMSSDEVKSVAIQSDGKIIVAGNSNTMASGPVFALARYNADGSLDDSFGGDGKVTTNFGEADTWVCSVAIQPDGKIIVVGSVGNSPNSAFAVVRYNTDGTPDNSFGAGGKVTTYFGTWAAGYAVTVQPDGKIVVAGSSLDPSNDFALARYNWDGTLDSSFGVDGKVTTDFGSGNAIGYSVALQPDGRIVVAGFTSSTSTGADFAVARYISGLNIGIVEFSLANTAPLIYPNPIKSHATLEYTLEGAETISIHLLDMQGKTVETFVDEQKQAAGDHQQAIDLPETLPSGSYLIAISSPTGKLTVQVVK